MIRKRRKRWKIKKGPLPFKYVLLITFIIFTFLSIFSVVIINRNLEPALMSIAESRARQFAVQAINDAIAKKATESIDINELIIKHENAGEASYSFNPQYNKVISELTIRVQEYLDLVETGDMESMENFRNDLNIDKDKAKSTKGIVYHIPLGMATKMTLLSNFGPKIPVRLEILGDVTSDLETKIVETGINNTYLEVYINVRVQMNVIIPLIEKPIEVSNQIKIGDWFHPGKVPQYYNGKGSENPIPALIPPPGN
ncbi:sporulation protein YunB [Bacillus sp. S/N-304-OC-R1]|uniref:sporulation protein YunB n=1 Tax=Bacillus sp. S/N-304-OC-R1 TaxID=2758034 RepID=UPI001C8D0769|nr:sporulation protein YunB [Bacillus sp. S/N-304-OC-R1]MBY0123016.1 sporulation protein YunB [Bacillus sp. S/N-304-OC-R1]